MAPLLLAALALATLRIAPACTTPEPWTADNPEIALRAFLDALEVRDYDTVWLFLPEATRARFTELAAEHAAALGETPGAEENPLQRVLVRVWSPSAFELDRLEQASADEQRATYVLHGIFGHRTTVEMVRVDERWTIDLLAPSATGGASP